MPHKNDDEIRGADSIIGHLIFIVLTLFNEFAKLLNMLLTDISKTNQNTLSIKDNKGKFNRVSEKNRNELIKLLKEIDILEEMSKEDLVKTLLSSQIAYEQFLKNEYKSKLMKMTNEELRLILKGTEGLSRLKKQELIMLILTKKSSI